MDNQVFTQEKEVTQNEVTTKLQSNNESIPQQSDNNNNNNNNQNSKGEIQTFEETCPANTELAGKADICKGCPGAQFCKSLSHAPPRDIQLEARLKAIDKKILVISGKGGVGKSSVAALLSLALATRNLRTGILDLDICGPSVARMLDLENRDIVSEEWGWIPVSPPSHQNLVAMSVALISKQRDNPVIWRGPRKTNLIQRFLRDTFWGKLSALIIDTPPGTSDEHISIVSILKNSNPDGAVIVTTPQEVALDTLRKEINFCKKMNLNILGIIENMSGFVCPCCEDFTELFHKTTSIEQIAKEHNIKILGKIPLDPRVTSTLDQGKCPFCEHKDSYVLKQINQVIDQLFL